LLLLAFLQGCWVQVCKRSHERCHQASDQQQLVLLLVVLRLLLWE
jgi:hypothetical protein